jgi:PPM family protein phosphatase
MLRVAEHWSGTDTGRQRRANEDSLLVRAPLFVVADGMGGAQAGEVASRMAVESFEHGLPDDATDPSDGLVELAREANARINEHSHLDPAHAGMGTTVTAVHVGGEQVSIVHVGDSRAYCLRGGELLRLTDDHSLVDELIRQGRLTPEEAEEHPQRSVITRALGPESSVDVDARAFRARAGDVYLLCSDGLTTMVDEDELARILSSHTRLSDAGRALIASANEAGGKDNITVVLARLEEVPGTGAVEAGRAQPTSDQAQPTSDRTQPTSDRTQPMSDQAQPTSDRTQPMSDQAQPMSDRTQPTSGQAPGREGLTGGPPATARDGATSVSQATSFASTAARQRRPRAPERRGDRGGRRRGRLRRARPALVLVVLLAAIAAGAYLASQSVYFIGTDSRGLVTIFQGVPFELPGGLKLYSTDYVSGVSASTLSPTRRRSLLDHELKSERKAAQLVRQLELRELSER